MQAFRLTFQHLESINPFAREVSGTFKIEFLSLLEKILLILGNYSTWISIVEIQGNFIDEINEIRALIYNSY